MRESAADKARRLLLERRVVVELRDAHTVRARVLGDASVVHEVQHTATTGWTCSCSAYSYRAACSHVIATQHVVVIGVDQ